MEKKTLRRRRVMAGILVVCILMATIMPGTAVKTEAAETARTETFVHPGMLHTAEAFEKAKANVENQVQPNLDTWNALLGDGYTKDSGWARPLTTVLRGGTGQNSAQLYIDILRAYQKALAWKIGGNEVYGDQACYILNAWSSTMTGLGGNADRFLASGIYGYELANAAEIMRDHPSFDKEAMEQLLLNVFYPMNNHFLKNHNDAHFGNYWANWDLCNIASMLAIGIFTDRQDIYDQAIEYYKSGIGMGSLYNTMPFVFEDGMAQWQESCRDQGHTVLGIGLCSVICEMAWNQGDDLYGLSDNRFLKAAEYVAKYNNWEDDGLQFAPYERNAGQKGTSEWYDGISPATRGQIRPIYSLIYNHYVNRKGLQAPNIGKILFPTEDTYAVETNTRSGDELGWQTLTFANLSESVPDQFTNGYFEDGIYRIRSAYTGKSLVVNEEGKLASAERGTREDEWWQLENLGDGEYIITNTVTNQVMQINDDCYTRGAVFGTGENKKSLNQRFAFAKNSNGTYRLVASVSTYVAGLYGDQTADDTAVVQWKSNLTTGQSWTLERKKEVLAQFTFDDEQTGFTDGHGVAAGSYSLQDHDGGKALYLNGTSDFLEVKAANGSSLLNGVKEVTVSFQAKPDQKGANWLFYAAPDTQPQNYGKEKYLGILADAGGNVKVERYNNTNGRPKTAETVPETNSDGWYYMTVVQTETETILYVDGEEKARQSSDYPLPDLLGENSILYIGKANWGNGEYYKGLIDNYTIYGRALTPAEIKGEAAKYGEMPEILADFTFDNEENGFTNGYGVAAGGHSLKPHGQGNALYLDGVTNCLEVENVYGTSLLTDVKEMTVSFQAKPDSRNTNWLFYAAPDANTQVYANEKYLGIVTDESDKATAQRFNNTNGRPEVTEAAAEADADGWYYLAVVYTEQETILYVNGKEAARQASDYTLPELLGTNSVLYIGRANWGSGEYYKGLIDNYKIIGRALTAEEVRKEAQNYNKREIAHFSFNDMEEGLYGSGAKAEIAGAAGIEKEGYAGGALSLPGTGESYLKVTKEDGTSLLDDVYEMTVSYYSKAEGNGTNWGFYAALDEQAQVYQKERYLGIFEKDGEIKAERYQGGRQETAQAEAESGWNHIVVVYGENTTSLYVNEVLVSEVENQGTVEEILGSGSILQIGKANWGGGEYYKGMLDEYRIFNYAMTMEEVKNLKVEADRKPDEEPKLPFLDVDEVTGGWYYKEVAYCYKQGMMRGVDAEGLYFAPNDAISRAQFAVILYRMEGEPEVSHDRKFMDVETDTWYTDAVAWASAAGVVTGYSDGCFGPADMITREQMATMMYRYAQYKKQDVSQRADIGRFADVSQISGFSLEAMQWAVGSSIIRGKGDGSLLDPQGRTSRAESAVILYRFRMRELHD